MNERNILSLLESSQIWKGQVRVCSHNDLERLTREGWTYETSTADLMHHLLSRPRTESERQSEAEAKANAEAARAHKRRNEVETEWRKLEREHRSRRMSKSFADRNELHALYERLKDRALAMERDIGKVSAAIGKIRWMEIIGDGE